MDEKLEQLVDSLLYEGYALYPYTPSATKNATPTPFGIVYPPAYAEGNAATFDHLRVDAVLEAADDAQVSGTALFLQQAGERHQGDARKIELGPVSVADLVSERVTDEFSFEGTRPVSGRARIRAERVSDGVVRVRMCVHNTTDAPGDLDRGEALQSSLISTHVVLETSAGRFVSPLERKGPLGDAVAECESANSFPVLASKDDRAILGAAIVLPDHPQMAPESRANMFDGTEIEEALILHVQALSDSEREQIEAQDPAVREMLARADAVTNDELMAMHGVMYPTGERGVPESFIPPGIKDPGPPPEPGHPNPGLEQIEVPRGTIRKGHKVILHPGAESRDPLDGMLEGRTATIERIYYDMDDKIHVGVTIDGDASQELYRETGRYVFFKGDEVEPVEPAVEHEEAK
ncbi:hypothetical protein BH24ACT23_BH24ACT23_07570 [soil metagenome]